MPSVLVPQVGPQFTYRFGAPAQKVRLSPLSLHLPDKMQFCAAFEKFDEEHDGRLSHARRRRAGAKTGLYKCDVQGWAKDNGDALFRLMSWAWKLNSRSVGSQSPSMKEIKSAFGRSPKASSILQFEPALLMR